MEARGIDLQRHKSRMLIGDHFDISANTCPIGLVSEGSSTQANYVDVGSSDGLFGGAIDQAQEDGGECPASVDGALALGDHRGAGS